MTAEEVWDVLVVGGGPAGSCAALAAADAGARVLVVDRRETIGSPVQCAEYLARKVVLDHWFPKAAIAQDVERTRTFIMGEEASVRRSPGCILNRDVADLVLWERAGEGGATAMAGTRVTSIETRTDGSYQVTMTREDEVSTHGATVLVGADGPRSTVGAALGVINRKMLVANQVTVPLEDPGQDTEVYLDPAFAGGYAWLFPKGDVANIGVGVDVSLGASPMGALAAFLQMLGDRVGDPISSTGGLIPVGGPLPMVHGRALLAGDAAGHTHPITGGGIHQALEAGRMAGEASAAYIAGDAGALEAYEPAFLDLFGTHLDRARDRRREMTVSWQRTCHGPEEFGRLARRGWIGFKEYFKETKEPKEAKESREATNGA